MWQKGIQQKANLGSLPTIGRPQERLEQVLNGRSFGNEGVGTGREWSRAGVQIQVVGDHAGPGPAGFDLDRRRDAVQTRHQDINHDHVGSQAIYFGDSLFAIGSLTNDLDPWVPSEYSGERSACPYAVVRD